eukprot:TRINITY_DN7136_c0_g1_i3.p1 TRINITY_DN7136_c0_g1~~TRINITY_DN7136_c0_g1_i3.p1  ORF type:complete len:372 (-),score=84.42 TRINITY_DN7136_c0_g1_i3:53-1114(-)
MDVEEKCSPGSGAGSQMPQRENATDFSATAMRSNLSKHGRADMQRPLAGNRPQRVDAMDFTETIRKMNLQKQNADSDKESESDASSSSQMPQRSHMMDNNLLKHGRADMQRPLAGDRPQRVDAMDFTETIRKMNLQKQNADSDTESESDASSSSQMPQRSHTMDFSATLTRFNLLRRGRDGMQRPLAGNQSQRVDAMDLTEIIRKMNSQRGNSDSDIDSDSDAEAAGQTPEGVSAATRNVGAYVNDQSAPVQQERAQWLNVRQEGVFVFEEISDAEIEAAIERRTSTAEPKDMASLSFEGDRDDSSDHSWEGEEPSADFLQPEPASKIATNDVADIPTPSLFIKAKSQAAGGD